MNWLLNILLIFGAFLLMEVIAWATHKYIMHGFLWSWHKSHHQAHDHPLEMNDLFVLVFSTPSILLIITGFEVESASWVKYIGFGISFYGLCYFIFHDIIVHRRIKIPFKAKNSYMKRIIRAHYIHHKTHTKEGAEAFGFLYAPGKYDEE